MIREKLAPIVNKEDACEAVGCLAKAVIWLTVNVGHHRKISLHLCKDCVSKFQGGEEIQMEALMYNNYSETCRNLKGMSQRDKTGKN
jgi:hypothetical protein